MPRTRHFATGAGLAIGALLMGAGVVRLFAPAPVSPDSPLWSALLTQGGWILLALGALEYVVVVAGVAEHHIGLAGARADQLVDGHLFAHRSASHEQSRRQYELT